MSANPLAVISTRLTPGACGIGAHSLLLRKHWPNGDQRVDFVVMEAAQEAGAVATSDRVVAFAGDAAHLAAELDRIGRADVLLHYAGRAYQRYGFPFWLPRVLERWKQKHRGARLMVLFHEVPGGGLPITSRHYWLARLNLWVVRQLTRIADVLVTNTEAHAQALRQLTTRSEVHVLPIGSNIELVRDERSARSATEFAIFGLPFGRLQVVRAFDAHVRHWHAGGQLTQVHVIGPTGDEFTSEAETVMRAWPASLSIVRHGMLPSPDVSRLLQRARFALTNVTSETWNKSGAFMACASHRCGVVIDGPRPHFVPLTHAIGAEEVDTISAHEVERRTAALANWAEENAAWPAIASRMAALLEQANGDGR